MGHGLRYSNSTKYHTVLVTLLISDTNSTAYRTFIYGLYLPYGPGVGLRGLGWRFLTFDREGIKGMKGNRNVGTKDAFCGAKRVLPLASEHCSLFCDDFLRVVT